MFTSVSPRRVVQETSFEAPITELISAKEFVGKFKPADQTPSVLNLKSFQAGNTVANNVTYFKDGQDGQSIAILGDGFTTVVHNTTKIKTGTAANKLLAVGKVCRFTRFNGVWVEESADAAAASPTVSVIGTLPLINTSSFTEVELGTVIVPANTLKTVGDCLRIIAHGDHTGSSSGGFVKVRFGPTVIIAQISGILNSPGHFYLETLVMRQTQTQQFCSMVGARWSLAGEQAATPLALTVQATEDLANAVIISFRGARNNGASGNLAFNGARVDYFSAT